MDNYYIDNPFQLYEYKGYYSSIHVEGYTDEWCINTDNVNIIQSVNIGGHDADIMMGYVYFDRVFSKQFNAILSEISEDSEYWHHVWEYLYML